MDSFSSCKPVSDAYSLKLEMGKTELYFHINQLQTGGSGLDIVETGGFVQLCIDVFLLRNV